MNRSTTPTTRNRTNIQVVGGGMPTQLQPAVEKRLEEHIRRSRSINTVKSYEYGWDVFSQWCLSQFGTEAVVGQVTTAVVLTYIDQMWEHGVPVRIANPEGDGGEQVEGGVPQLRGFKVSTILNRLGAIRDKYIEANLQSPTSHPDVDRVLAGLRKKTAQMAKAGDTSKTAWEADPIEDHQLKLIVDSQPTNTLIGLRNRALLLMGFSLCARRSELSTLMVKHVRPSQSIVGGWEVELYNRKTNQDGVDVVGVEAVPDSPYCPVTAYNTYVEACGINEGLVFRSIGKGGRLGGHDKVGGKLSPQAIDRIVWKLATSVLGDGRWSAHSLRAGYATTANRLGLSRVDICKQGGWSESSSVHYRYERRGKISTVKRVMLR